MTSSTADPIDCSAVPAFIETAPPTVPGMPTANSRPDSPRSNASVTMRWSTAPAPTCKRCSSSNRKRRNSLPSVMTAPR